MMESIITNRRLTGDGMLLLKRIEASEIHESAHQNIKLPHEEITEHKRMEEMLLHAAEEWRATFDSIADMISIQSNDFKVLRANTAFSDCMKMKPKDIIGQTCYKLVHGTDNPPPYCPLLSTFKEQKSFTVKFFEPHIGMHLEVTTTPVATENDGADRCVHVMRNINQRIEYEHKLQKNSDKLLAVVEDTIEAIAATVEIRDPYTAGHQLRVSDLACTIAKEMGLSEERAQSIRLAGIVHDIGKIHIPSEILSKPHKINDIEYGMVKVHPFAGYNILKKVRFPWPIANIVLQHHERMDGSGYPGGLHGGNILLEARILAVADVIEAMSSSRPYRSTPGTYEALKEIAKKAGVEYDTTVVIACLKLFKEKRYEFPKSYNRTPGEFQCQNTEDTIKTSTVT